MTWHEPSFDQRVKLSDVVAEHLEHARLGAGDYVIRAETTAETGARSHTALSARPPRRRGVVPSKRANGLPLRTTFDGESYLPGTDDSARLP